MLRDALDARDAQGPAMARVLEAVGLAALPGVKVTSLRTEQDLDHWKLTLDAFAAGANESAAREIADRFLRALDQSPIFDEQLQPRTRRFVTAPGGVDIAAIYQVRK